MKKKRQVVTYRGWVGNILCDSSWEMAFVAYCLDNGIEVVRNTRNFAYVYYNKTRYYRPDFLVDDGTNQTYVEIKGYMDGKSKRKLDWFNYPIMVIGQKEIGFYLKYAKTVYGERYWETILEKYKK